MLLSAANADEGPRVAVHVTGHLRPLCDSNVNFAVLEDEVAACRVHAHCDVFVHTWDILEALTRSWHSAPQPFAPSSACAHKLAAAIRPASLAVEVEHPFGAGRYGDATWFRGGGVQGRARGAVGGRRRRRGPGQRLGAWLTETHKSRCPGAI